MDGIHVKMTSVSDTEETDIVNLSFNGQTSSEDGFSNFHFVMDNRSKEWEVFEGLTWIKPLPEYPTGDRRPRFPPHEHQKLWEWSEQRNPPGNPRCLNDSEFTERLLNNYTPTRRHSIK